MSFTFACGGDTAPVEWISFLILDFGQSGRDDDVHVATSLSDSVDKRSAATDPIVALLAHFSSVASGTS